MAGIASDVALRRLAAAGLICVLIAWAGAVAFAGAFVGQIVKSSGDITITRDGAAIAASASTALQLGDVIKTGPEARVRIRFVDGSILTLGEKSALSIDVFSIDAANKSRTVVFTMLEGIVNAAAAKSGESSFDYQIKTASGYSAVRGTKWIVASRKQVMSVYVLNGQVEVGLNSGKLKPALVDTGKSVTIDASGALGPVAPTPADVLQRMLDATSDTGGASTVPTTTPVPITTPPVTPIVPVFPRALRNGNQHDQTNDKRGVTGN